jgi:DNA-binding CsgD family transcriptional regulator
MTPRELKILTQLVEGKSYGQIAANLMISYKTVANTYSRLKTKIGARSLPELMQIAMQHLPQAQEAKLAPMPRLSSVDEPAALGKVAPRRQGSTKR